MKYHFRTLIPAAGFGTRMNMPKNQSKEMLIDPKTGRPLIEWTLEKSINPLVITRKEKVDLIHYCVQNSVDYEIIEPEGEWMDSILAVENFWGNRNILLLPDTRFDHPEFAVEQLFSSLITFDLVFGIHEVDDISKWGAFRDNGWGTDLCEKPKETGPGEAWGVLGFSRRAGRQLFEEFKSKKWFDVWSQFFKIENFKDVTRTGVIEY